MCVWACHVTQYHSNVKNKVVANLTVRIEFTYGIVFIIAHISTNDATVEGLYYTNSLLSVPCDIECRRNKQYIITV